MPEGWISPDDLAQHPVVTIAADEMPGIEREAAAMGADDDPELVEKLRERGYIE